MKRIIAAVVLALIVAGLCFADVVMTNRIYNTLSANIKECRSAFLQKDYITAEKKAKELEQNWTEREDIFSLFINHELIDEMGVSVAKLVPLAKTQDDMFLIECRVVEMTLKHIKNDSRVNLHSIL
ncbi:MAG: DUF4363 family protein [Ruminococcaceae bacterium]|nr:DUF4363 family protein [Oscillospiraceae bacterium]